MKCKKQAKVPLKSGIYGLGLFRGNSGGELFLPALGHSLSVRTQPSAVLALDSNQGFEYEHEYHLTEYEYGGKQKRGSVERVVSILNARTVHAESARVRRETTSCLP
jgi:hypothetical protein